MYAMQYDNSCWLVWGLLQGDPEEGEHQGVHSEPEGDSGVYYYPQRP